MQQYVVGFAILNTDMVLLINKKRPKWQEGKLNGIGGHVEDTEQPLDAMIREFGEETGVGIKNWELFVILQCENCIVYFYRTDISIHLAAKCRTITDENLQWVKIREKFPNNVIFNLNWLIPMSFDTLNFPITINDKGAY